MNSLEFIEKEIKYWQKTINTARSEKLTQIIIVSLNPLYKVENVTLSDYDILLIEEKLQTLQQIKTELEAWEVVKENMGMNVNETGYEMNIIFWHDKENFIKLKKALEVKDDK